MGYWGEVTKRAFAEARAEVRLDKPVRIVTSVIAPLLSAGIVWWATGSPAWGGIVGVALLLTIGLTVFVCKLLTVPIARANEARVQLDAVLATLPTRDPDGVYQHGALVAKVVRPLVDMSKSSAIFDAINGGADFDIKQPFEYRDLQLEVYHADLESSMTINGQSTNSLGGVQAKVTGRGPGGPESR